ncbi:hypothetical protein ABZ858_08400 [Streptomyces sp. NPDC047017]|uniref:hypothetical protein n=1 Tax=Streptomyces sp. NPDC047017 TaxID=3155024 RepID=UPI0033E9B964
MIGATHAIPARLSRRVGGALHWQRVLRRERRLARERELSLLSEAEAHIMSAWLAGENPRHCPEVRDALDSLAGAVFDADLLSAWDKRERPYDVTVLGGGPHGPV